MSKIILESVRTSKGNGLHNRKIQASTVIRQFKRGDFFIRENIDLPPEDCMVTKDNFKAGDIVSLRFGENLTNLMSYVVQSSDLILEIPESEENEGEVSHA